MEPQPLFMNRLFFPLHGVEVFYQTGIASARELAVLVRAQMAGLQPEVHYRTLEGVPFFYAIIQTREFRARRFFIGLCAAAFTVDEAKALRAAVIVSKKSIPYALMERSEHASALFAVDVINCVMTAVSRDIVGAIDLAATLSPVKVDPRWLDMSSLPIGLMPDTPLPTISEVPDPQKISSKEELHWYMRSASILLHAARVNRTSPYGGLQARIPATFLIYNVLPVYIHLIMVDLPHTMQRVYPLFDPAKVTPEEFMQILGRFAGIQTVITAPYPKGARNLYTLMAAITGTHDETLGACLRLTSLLLHGRVETPALTEWRVDMMDLGFILNFQDLEDATTIRIPPRSTSRALPSPPEPSVGPPEPRARARVPADWVLDSYHYGNCSKLELVA